MNELSTFQRGSKIFGEKKEGHTIQATPLIRNKEMSRYKCDECGRVLKIESKNPFKCTACGHGYMHLQNPKNYCCECMQPIYDNVDKNREVICSDCTQMKIVSIRSLEGEFKYSIRKFQSKKRKRRKKPLGIIRRKKDYVFASHIQKAKEDKEKITNKELVEARKKRGLSQQTLAVYLGCSKHYLSMMEKARKPLNKKALKFIKEGLKIQKSQSVIIPATTNLHRAEKRLTFSIENKGIILAKMRKKA